jgi:hypothetical protein
VSEIVWLTAEPLVELTNRRLFVALPADGAELVVTVVLFPVAQVSFV